MNKYQAFINGKEWEIQADSESEALRKCAQIEANDSIEPSAEEKLKYQLRVKNAK